MSGSRHLQQQAVLPPSEYLTCHAWVWGPDLVSSWRDEHEHWSQLRFDPIAASELPAEDFGPEVVVDT